MAHQSKAKTLSTSGSLDRVLVHVPDSNGPFLKSIDQYRYWIFAAILVLYLLGFNGQWHFGPDSALHLGIARNIATGQGFFYTGGEQAQVHPGLAYLVASTFWVFGSEGLVPVHFLMLLIGLVALSLNFAIVSMHAGRAVGVLVTALLATTETFYRYAFQVLTDLPFLVGLLLCLAGFQIAEQSKHSRWWSGMLVMLGVMTMAVFRSVVLTAVVAVVLALIWSIVVGRRRVYSCVLLLILVASLMVVRVSDPRSSGLLNPLPDEQSLHRFVGDVPPHTSEHKLVKNLQLLLTEATCEAMFAIDLGPIVSLPLSLVVLGLGIGLIRTRVLWGLLVLVFIGQWLLVLVSDRYFLPVLPLLIYGWWRGVCWLSSQVGGVWSVRLMATALLLWFVPNLIKIGDFVIDQQSIPFVHTYQDGKYERVVELAKWLKANSPDDALVLTNMEFPREFSFLSGRKVERLRRLHGWDPQGSKVYVLEGTDEVANRLAAIKLRRRGWSLGSLVGTVSSSDHRLSCSLRVVEIMDHSK